MTGGGAARPAARSVPASRGEGMSVAAPVVVKIGGSLLEARDGEIPERLRCVLSLLDRAARPVVVVPGGGAFADAVRQEQQRLGLSDKAAHRMAQLAMHQVALVIADCAVQAACARRFVAAECEAAIGGALAARHIPIWLPLPMTDGDPAIPEDWSVTSDSLAAWLAARLSVPQLVLLKSAPVPAGSTAAELATAGIVDPVFARFVGESALSWRVLGPGDLGELAAIVGADVQPDAPPEAMPRSSEARRR